jgi:hypothetical protein
MGVLVAAGLIGWGGVDVATALVVAGIIQFVAWAGRVAVDSAVAKTQTADFRPTRLK